MIPIKPRIDLLLLFLLLTAPLPWANAATAEPTPPVRADYIADTRTLTIHIDDHPRYRYVFNKGGAINGVYDLAIMPNQNLVGQSYKGETTDRVIQWTYWNSRYRGEPHNLGSKDTRANVTMEGCFGDHKTCDVLETPETGETRELVFKSRITHWFFAILDRHGQPDFNTTSHYEVLNDGSLKLTRSITRKPWLLKNVTAIDKNKRETKHESIPLQSTRVKGQPVASYLESWTPLRSGPLPKQRHAKGDFKKFGYRLHTPKDLGGWAMAYGDDLAFAVVFGDQKLKDNPHQTETVYNNLLLDYHKLNILLPAIITDWPDNATLTQTLIFVLDAPEQAKKKAIRWVDDVPPPSVK